MFTSARRRNFLIRAKHLTHVSRDFSRVSKVLKYAKEAITNDKTYAAGYTGELAFRKTIFRHLQQWKILVFSLFLIRRIEMFYNCSLKTQANDVFRKKRYQRKGGTGCNGKRFKVNNGGL